MKARWFACLLAWAPALASAQASYSVGAVSDYRYRGVSLSGERPSVQANANFDHASGAYAGLSLARVRLGYYTRADLQWTAYAGYARRIGDNWSVDAGAVAVRFNGGRNYDYREFHVGVARERLGARVAVSPHYYGVGGRTVYGEVNGSIALSPALELLAHAGYLYPEAGRWKYVPPARADIRLGVQAMVEAWSLQLAFSATREGAAVYPNGRNAHARRLLAGATRNF